MRNCYLNNAAVHIRTPISAPVSVVIESIKEIPKGNQIAGLFEKMACKGKEETVTADRTIAQP